MELNFIEIPSPSLVSRELILFSAFPHYYCDEFKERSPPPSVDWDTHRILCHSIESVPTLSPFILSTARRVFQLVSYSVDPKECINPSAGSSVGRTDGWIASQPASQWRIRIEEEQRHQHQCDKEWISMSHCCWTNCHSFILHVSSTWNGSLSLSTSGATALALHTINSGIVPLQLLSK